MTNLEKGNKRERIYFLDELRGFAIAAMIVHHTFLDIGNIYMADWGFKAFDRLCTFQPIFWSIFIIISGVCSRLSRNTLKRGAIVLAAGLAVTVATAVIMPMMHIYKCEIYFGILHCLGCCMIITGLLMPFIKKIKPSVGMAASALLFMLTYGISDKTLMFGLIHLPESLYQTNILFPLGFYNADFASADYFALLPWLFMFLFGAFAGQYVKEGRLPRWTYKKHSKVFAFIGKNSLWFYLGHQVVIYAVLYAIMYISIWIKM